MAGQEGVLAVYSPMARTCEDLEYFWRSYLSMNPWTYDHHVHPIPWREEDFQAGKSGKLRYGVMRDDGVVTPSPACARALDSVVDTLREAGEEVIELDLEGMPSPYEGLKLASILLNTDGGKTYESFFTSWFEYNDAGVAKMSKWFKTPWVVKKLYVWWVRYVQKDEMWAGLLDTHWREQTTPEQWKLVGRREDYRRAWHEYLNAKGVDILLTVPNATPAVPKDGMSTAIAACGYTFLFNLVGLFFSICFSRKKNIFVVLIFLVGLLCWRSPDHQSRPAERPTSFDFQYQKAERRRIRRVCSLQRHKDGGVARWSSSCRSTIGRRESSGRNGSD